MLARRLPGLLPPLDASRRRSRRRWSTASPGSPATAGSSPSGRSARRTTPSRDAGLVGGSELASPGRDLARAPRRPLPRRAARVPPPRPRGDAPAARGRRGRDRARAAASVTYPAQVDARRRDEPVPVRPPRRPAARAAAAPRTSSCATGAASPGRCWTGSTCTSTCPRSRRALLGTGGAEPTAAVRARVAARAGSPGRARPRRDGARERAAPRRGAPRASARPTTPGKRLLAGGGRAARPVRARPRQGPARRADHRGPGGRGRGPGGARRRGDPVPRARSAAG